MIRRSPRLAALLLVGATIGVSACGSSAEPGGDDGTTASHALSASSSPRALPVRDDLIDPQVVPWRTWRAVDDWTLELTVTAGLADCYGAEPEVAESETAVHLRVRVGLLPSAAGKECPAIAVESVVLVRLAAPLGTRKVAHLA
jgi:hypothetical protein